MTDISAKIDGLAGILLAAGGSTRLGVPKQLVDYAGRQLICRTLDAAGAICGAGLVVVTGAGADDVEAAISGYPVSVTRNPHWQDGMGSSIATGIGALSDTDFTGVLIMLCDQPLVSGKDIARLAEVWQQAPNRPAAASYKNRIGVPAIFPVAYTDQLAKLEGDKGARALLNGNADISSVDMPAAAFDIDTPDDLQELQNL